MKLLLCSKCSDIIKLGDKVNRHCACGKSWGRYTDDINAVYGGESIMIGLSNPSLAYAIRKKPRQDGWGNEFEGFTIPEDASSVQREK